MALPQLSNVMRTGSGVLYHTIALTVAGGSLSNSIQNFFGTPKGQAFPGSAVAATLAETNLLTGGQIPGGNAFTVHGLAMQYFYTASKASLTAADLHNLVDSSVLSWNLSQTSIEIAPTSMIPSGAPISGVAGTVGAVVSELAATSGIFRIKPMVLAPNAVFGISMQFGSSATTPSATIHARCVLVGEYMSSVAAG